MTNGETYSAGQILYGLQVRLLFSIYHNRPCAHTPTRSESVNDQTRKIATASCSAYGTISPTKSLQVQSVWREHDDSAKGVVIRAYTALLYTLSATLDQRTDRITCSIYTQTSSAAQKLAPKPQNGCHGHRGDKGKSLDAFLPHNNRM